MDLNENIRNNIQRLRKERNVTQDVLAAALEISVQAISKWETGASLPDIMQLPRIAKFFGVTIDYLFYNEGADQMADIDVVSRELPEDQILRIIQFKGNRMLGSNIWEKDKSISLILPEEISNGNSPVKLNVEVWGNADIKGNIGGNAQSGGNINCGDIGGNTECSGSLSGGNIGGHVECGDSVNCGNIGSYAECDGGINCGNIGGNVECSGSLNSGDVSGSIECDGNISCGDIAGNVDCDGDISCNIINNRVECEGDIRCKEIRGNIECEGNIIYER